MSGNCATGSAPSAITPAIEMTIEITIASRGRWMKTDEIIVGIRLLSTGRRRRQLRRYSNSRPDTLLPLNDDPVLRLYSVLDDREALAAGAELKAALLDFIVLADDKH